MKILLSALSPKILDAFTHFFGNANHVEILGSNIVELECDAIASPANSFGFMDGGLDRTLSERFGWELQERLQQKIKELPEGELLVGQAMVLETKDEKIPYLISTPTMRVPMNFNIPTSVNAYLAMKACLLQAVRTEGITSVAIPAFCTGAGGMEPMIACHQMFEAYKEIILGERKDFENFGQAQQAQLHLNPSARLYS